MKIPLSLLILCCLLPMQSLVAWKPAEHTLLTPWGEQVKPANVWTQYPRPQMQRDAWTNLNGLWDYQVTGRGAAEPEQWEGQILVPFAIETPLSGVGRRLEANEALWYRRFFQIDPQDGRMLLHFEGVDYECMVWLNGKHVGSHRGGNMPFSFDISEVMKEGENVLVLRVIDETDAFDRYQFRGKQKVDNSGIWYTPSSGIWQTVWLEPVAEQYLQEIRMLADMHGKLTLRAEVGGSQSDDLQIEVQVDCDTTPVRNRGPADAPLTLLVPEVQCWSPESPTLYDLKVRLLDRDGQVLDEVKSYAGFRSVGKVRDDHGHWQFTLNGAPIFHFGPLDQGWWPGSFLNPPADEAIVFEMNYLKAAGFNMIRKHKKVEPRRYYYHADRIGLLVWQDQTSAGAGPNEWPKWKKLRAESEGYQPDNPNWWSKPEHKLDADWPHWAHELYMAELKTMIDTLYNHPSVVVWTTFNERWGQHRSMEVGNWVVAYDPSRHLNIASGGNFFPIGDIADEHDYPDPSFPLENPMFDDYIKVVGEYGGHGFPVEGHLWDPGKRNWGYGGLPATMEEFKARYVRTAKQMGELRQAGISAGVYTQTTDVEGEINGLMTYDRKVMKLSAEELRRIHVEAGLVAEVHSPELSFTYQNPIGGGIDPRGLRDCQVIRDGDWWYLTGTSYPHWSRQEVDGELNPGVALYRSKDLLNWEFLSFIVERPGPDKWYYRRFWAPEIQKIQGKYYALFNCRNDDLGFVGQWTGFAVADHIEGPYRVVTDEKPLVEGNDLTFFEDDDGVVWAFWNRGRNFGIGYAQVDLERGVLLSEPVSAIRPGEVEFGYEADGQLQYEPGYDGRPIPKVIRYHDWDSIGIEGAYVIKHQDTYVLFYSSWTRGYEIGYATAPSIQGPWVKSPGNPFYGAMHREACVKNGFEWSGDENSPFTAVGHNQVFVGPDGRYWLSCHGITQGGNPLLVIDPIWFDEDGTVRSTGPTYTPQTIPLRP
jgi:hypothetical protein